MPETRVLMSVGDDSGDLHAANLMRALRALRPDVRFVGFGMARMAELGLESIATEEPHGSAMWLHNVARMGHYRRRLDACCDYIDREGVDLVLPVDFGGFNLVLCREATRRGVPSFYYIPPQVWAHATYRLKKLRKWVTRAGLIYPFEPALYERYGVAAEYVGHPLFDEMERNPPSPEAVERLRARFGPNLIGLFPGSRLQEVRAHMSMLRAACRTIRAAVPDATFALRCPPGLAGVVGEMPGDGGLIATVEDATALELARASRICLTKSGTVTLEIASQGTPMVVFYRCAPVLLFIAYGLARAPWMTLANTLAGREICPEKVMGHDDPKWLAREGLRLLQDAEEYEACRRAIGAALDGFAVPGASARAADAALSLL
jgi:lipid-A-disaccharide synthase